MKTLKKLISCALTVFLLVSSAMFLLPAQKVQATTNGHTRDEAVAWATGLIGNGWDYDGSEGVQCVDIIYKYIDEYLGHPELLTNNTYPYWGNAIDYAYKTLPSGWKYASSPEPGDIVIWGKGVNMGCYIDAQWQGNEYADSGCGHIGIVLGVRSSTIVTVEQNTYSGYPGGGRNASPRERTTSSALTYIRPDFIHNTSPKGKVEACEVQYNQLLVRGWTYDPDESSKSISVDVYANDKFIKRISANNDSSSINSSYGISGSHRFSEYIELPEGNYTIKIYALDTSGNGNIQLGSSVGSSSTYNVSIGKSTKISNVVVSDISSDGYTVSCKVIDESGSGIYVVEFPTYSNADGRDDLINYCPPHETSDDIYSVRVNTSEHNNETGLFNTTIRAYDYNGNYKSFAVRVAVPERTFPTLKRINYVVDNDHLYVLYEGCKNWATAENYCVSVGGHLASITSASENEVVRNLVSKGNENTYYFGAYDYGSEGVFVFTDGSSTASYTNWDNGEPNNSSSENYGDFYQSGAWNDCNGTNRNGFILEIDLNKVSTVDVKNNLGIDLTKYYPQNRTKDDAVAWANSQVRSTNASSVDLIYRYFDYFGYNSQAYGIDVSFANRSLPSGWKYVYSDYQPGDIAVWKTDMWSVCEKGNYNVDSEGFVGIIADADSTGFVAITQNFYYTQGSCSKVWFKIGDLQCAIRPAYAPSSYSISLKEVTNGTVSLSKTTAAVGDEITVTATAEEGYAVRAILVDGVEISGNKFTMPAKDVTVEAVISPVVKINTQPENYTGIVGKTAKFTVGATGEELTYQWQVYKNGAWKNTSLTGATTDTLSVGVVESRNGMSFRCIVTDAYGDTVISEAVNLTVLTVAITEQPVDYTGAIGETATFTVGAAGSGLTYQWQIYKSGVWKNTSLTGATTNKLSVGIVSSRNGMMFRCLVTSSNGKVIVSEPTVLNVKTVEIAIQPEDYQASIGETAEFYVGVEGEGITYQWQVYKNSAWKNTSLPGATTDTLSVEALNSRDGMQFRCIVTDANGSKATSDTAILTVMPIAITEQPEDYTGTIGETADFHVGAEGEGITYQWQVYKNGAWKNTSLPGNNTNTLAVEVLSSRNGMIFRCIVKDANENKLISEEVTLSIEPITITEQPEDYKGTIGDTAEFTIEAEGEGLTYQWQVYKNGAWKNTSLPGNKTGTLDVEILASRDGMQFRCVITDENGNDTITDEVILSVLPITIVVQPENYTGAIGETAVFFVEAEGEGLTYQWQVYKNGAWKNTSLTGNDRPSLVVDVLASRDGMQFRCVISDANGSEVATNEVTINVINN